MVEGEDSYFDDSGELCSLLPIRDKLLSLDDKHQLNSDPRSSSMRDEALDSLDEMIVAALGEVWNTLTRAGSMDNLSIGDAKCLAAVNFGLSGRKASEITEDLGKYLAGYVLSGGVTEKPVILINTIYDRCVPTITIKRGFLPPHENFFMALPGKEDEQHPVRLGLAADPGERICRLKLATMERSYRLDYHSSLIRAFSAVVEEQSQIQPGSSVESRMLEINPALFPDLDYRINSESGKSLESCWFEADDIKNGTGTRMQIVAGNKNIRGALLKFAEEVSIDTERVFYYLTQRFHLNDKSTLRVAAELFTYLNPYRGEQVLMAITDNKCEDIHVRLKDGSLPSTGCLVTADIYDSGHHLKDYVIMDDPQSRSYTWDYSTQDEISEMIPGTGGRSAKTRDLRIDPIFFPELAVRRYEAKDHSSPFEISGSSAIGFLCSSRMIQIAAGEQNVAGLLFNLSQHASIDQRLLQGSEMSRSI